MPEKIIRIGLRQFGWDSTKEEESVGIDRQLMIENIGGIMAIFLFLALIFGLHLMHHLQ